MKRLFTLKHEDGSNYLLDGKPMYFREKEDAKSIRDSLKEKGIHTKVSRGPDHDGATKSQHRNTRKKNLRGTRNGSSRTIVA